MSPPAAAAAAAAQGLGPQGDSPCDPQLARRRLERELLPLTRMKCVALLSYIASSHPRPRPLLGRCPSLPSMGEVGCSPSWRCVGVPGGSGWLLLLLLRLALDSCEPLLPLLGRSSIAGAGDSCGAGRPPAAAAAVALGCAASQLAWACTCNTQGLLISLATISLGH